MSRVVFLNALQALDAALRLGSMKRASVELGITSAAVGQRISALEAFTGTRLLERGPIGVTATPAAQGVQSLLRRAFDDLDQVAMRLNLDRDGPIRIACDSDFLALWLRPRLPGFHAQFPGSKLAFLREGDPAPPDLWISFGGAGAVLLNDWLVPVASTENLGRVKAGDPNFPLEGFPLLHVGPTPGLKAEHGWPDWIARFGQRQTGPNRGFRYRHFADAHAFATANVGIALLPLTLVWADLQSGTLHRLLPQLPLMQARNAWTLKWADPSIARPNLRHFSDWLHQEAALFLACQPTADASGELPMELGAPPG
jgi:LysR family glycine cleavage system transcriptional activator